MITIRTSRQMSRDILLFAYDYLKLTDDVSLLIADNDALLDKFSPKGYDLEAMLCKQPLPHTYVLYIRKSVNIGKNILAHEMVHLWQQETGKLTVDNKSGMCVWNGKEYPASLAYDKRLWEQEAFKIEKKIIKEYKKWQKK